jgi:hypothetical protein
MKKKMYGIAATMILAALITALILPGDSEAAKRKVLFPYKMVVESATGFDSVINLSDNLTYHEGDADGNADQGSAKRRDKGLYNHIFRFDHRDSAKTLTFDSAAFYFDLIDYDAGEIFYGYENLLAFNVDSATAQIHVLAEIGTEIPIHNEGEWKMIRQIALQDHGAGTDPVDTLDLFEGGVVDSVHMVSLGFNADSVMYGDKLRLLFVYKDSTQVADTLIDDGLEHSYRAFMFVKEEY